MRNVTARVLIGGAILLSLSQVGGAAAIAQDSCSGPNYAVAAREGDFVFLLNQRDGAIYRCSLTIRGTCARHSSIG